MWLDRIIVILAMGLLIAFCGIIVYFVAEPDLAIIMTVGLSLAVYDFWDSVFRDKPEDQQRK